MIKEEIIAVNGNEKSKKYDDVAIEEILKIYVNKKKCFSILCSPENLEYLVYGFMFTSGLIKDKTGVKFLTIKNGCCYVEVEDDKIEPCQDDLVLVKGKKISSPFFTVPPSKISELMRIFENRSKTYRLTGGVHSAALSDGEKIVFFHEDIGRHNVFDKVIGEVLVKGVYTADKMFLTSGRISSEIVSKCARANIPLIISISAPTDFAIKQADFYGITLVGFARGKKFNIYTHYERIQ